MVMNRRDKGLTTRVDTRVSEVLHGRGLPFIGSACAGFTPPGRIKTAVPGAPSLITEQGARAGLPCHRLDRGGLVREGFFS